MLCYSFMITISGCGEDVNEAWEDAVENFYCNVDANPPDEYDVEENNEDD